jgi:hypothetical protein
MDVSKADRLFMHQILATKSDRAHVMSSFFGREKEAATSNRAHVMSSFFGREKEATKSDRAHVMSSFFGRENKLPRVIATNHKTIFLCFLLRKNRSCHE